MAQDADGDDLSFSMVLDTVKEFLRLHPTETVILDLRPETEDDSEKTKIYPRARTILAAEALEINPSTGEPYLYKEPGSDDYFATYTSMPKLADCRGKIVLMPDNNDFTNQVGGFVRGDLIGGDVRAALDYQNTKEMMVQQMQEEYQKANQRTDPVEIPADASERLRKLWYWELNCTGQHAENGQYYYNMDAPHKLAEYVNGQLIGDGNLLGTATTGQYIGWVRMDSFNGKYAEEIWKTNFFDTLDYCTVTVKSGLGNEKNYPDQKHKLLKGTKLTAPGNIYKELDEGLYFDYWEADSGERFSSGDTVWIEQDITLTAHWLENGEIPVRVIWQDGDNKDKLRADRITLRVSIPPETGEEPASKEMQFKEEEDWSGTVTAPIGKESEVLFTPEWERIDLNNSEKGRDKEGQYRYEVDFEHGTGFTVTLIHTPQSKITISGEVRWDDDNANALRPENVTIRLLKNGVETGGYANDVSETTNGWKFTFDQRTEYENGVKIAYSVKEDKIEGYETVYPAPEDQTAADGSSVRWFTVVNSHSTPQDTLSLDGFVVWDDADNAKGIRPTKTTVHLLADNVEYDSKEVEPSELGLWYWYFEKVPNTNGAGGTIDYAVTADAVEGYTVSCELIDLIASKDAAETGSETQGSSSNTDTEEERKACLFLITYTLEVSEDEKEPSTVSRAPKAREPIYNGTAQLLIEDGEAEGGIMLYALGDSADTAPEASAYSTELPVGTNAGTYYVWYYVKGDVMHKDTGAAFLEVQIGKAAQTVRAADVSGASWEAGKAVKAEVTGVDGATEGVGTLSFKVTEGSDSATVDASTGALTLRKPGTATVTVSAEETANYAAAETTVTVTVEHVHVLTHVEAKAAVCEEDGNIEYWVCDGGDYPCGKHFSDAEGNKEITQESTVIGKLGHDWGEWKVSQKATAEAAGIETRTCRNDTTHTETRTITMMSITLPTAKSGLAYNTEAQNLVNAGETSAGTMQYVIGTDMVTPPMDDEDWSTSVPTGTDAGSYYVWYKVVGDRLYADTTPACILITIGKAAGSIGFELETVKRIYGDEKFTNPLSNTGDGTVSYQSSNPSVATVDPATGEVTIVAVGTATVIATVTGGANYQYNTVQASYTLTVSPKSASIHYSDTLVTKPYSFEGTFTNLLTNTGDGTVSYQSSDPLVATVNATTGEVTIIKVGTAIITATAADSATCSYSEETKTASYTLTVVKAENPGVVASSASVQAGGNTIKLNSLVQMAVGKVTYEITGDALGCTVNGETGIFISGDQIDEVTVTVTISGDEYFKEKTGTIAVRVIENNTVIIPPPPGFAEITYGEYDVRDFIMIGWTNFPENASMHFTGTSLNGTAYDNDTPPKDAGNYIVTVSYEEGGVLKQTPIYTRIKPISLSDPDTSVTLGNTLTYNGSEQTKEVIKVTWKGTVTVKNENGEKENKTVTVEVPAEAYTVTNNKRTNAGSYILTVTANPNGNCTDFCNVTFTIDKAEGSISYEQTSVTKTWGDDAFTNKLTNTGDGTVSYASSNTNVATVDKKTGKVTIKGAGTATITATAEDGTNYTYKNAASYYLTVNKADARLTREPTAKTNLVYSAAEQTLVNAGRTNDGTIQYALGTGDAAPTEGWSDDIPKQTKAGTYYVWYKVNGDDNHNNTEARGPVPVTVERLEAEIVWSDTSLVYNGEPKAPTAAVRNLLPGDSCDVTVQGAQSNAGVHTATATALSNENYKLPADATTKFTIEKQTIVPGFALSPVTKTYGDEPFTNMLTNTGDGAVSYSSSDESVATVNATSGEVTIIGVGTATVTAKVSVGTNYRYDPTGASYTLTVLPKAASIRYYGPPVTKTYGDDPFTNPLTNTGDGTASYASSNTNVATVDEETGEVTIKGAGTATVTATVSGGTNYQYDPASASYMLTVVQNSASIRYAVTSVTKAYGDAAFANLLTNTGDGTVSYASNNTNVATVNPTTGEVTINGIGEARITAMASNSANYSYSEESKTASYTLTVEKGTVKIVKPELVQGLEYTGGSQALVTPGSTGDGTIQYAIGTDADTVPMDKDWSKSVPSGIEAGIYTVWFRVIGDSNHNDAAPVSMSAYIAPAAADGGVENNTLYYTGEDQDLLTPKETKNGELMYALGTADEAPDSDSDAWSETVPRGRDVGTYYVWYYVMGDQNYKDTEPTLATVRILASYTSYDVTFRVSNGGWNDGTTADKTVTVEGYKTQNSSPLKLTQTEIPTVGNNPERYYDAGSWDMTPDTETEITQNTTYTYTYQKIVYTLTEGAGQTHTKGSGGSLTFTIKRFADDATTYGHFTAVTYGTALLTRDQDYTAASGSLVLTLQPAFLETLEPGTHSVNVAFDDAADPVLVPFTVAPAVYTVTFHSNGHGIAPVAQRVTDGDPATKPTDPAAAGYTFGGWYTDAQCRNAYNFTTPVTANLTLYGKWTANTPGSDTSGSNKPGSNSSGTDSSAANPSGSSSTNSSSRSSSVTGPKTGDPGRTGLWVVMLLISMAGLCGIAVTYDKSRRKETYLGKAGQDEGGQGHN